MSVIKKMQDAVDWPSPTERNPNRTMRGEFCSLLADLQREWMKEGSEDGSEAINAAYEALHQFVSRIANETHAVLTPRQKRIRDTLRNRLRNLPDDYGLDTTTAKDKTP